MDLTRLYYDTYNGPLGRIYLVMMDSLLVGLCFERPHMRAARAPEELVHELDAYFDGTLREFSQKVSLINGTEFEKQVWLALRRIPYGETRTYKWMAEAVGCPKGSRAVGQALKKNPIPIVLPCHRIIESDGNLGGYSSGEDIKRRLLQMEFYHLREQGQVIN